MIDKNLAEYLDKLALEYSVTLLTRDKHGAMRMILDAHEKGVSQIDLYQNVLQVAQYRIGELWQSGRISVAQEHFCTAVTQSLVVRLNPDFPEQEKNGKTFLGMCVSDEQHDIGIQMITGCAAGAGFDTAYLGANVPSDHIVEAISDYKADIVGISITLAHHLGALTNLIATIRSAPEATGVKIVVGGYCLNAVNGLWQKTGADGWAENCEDARKKFAHLTGKTEG